MKTVKFRIWNGIDMEYNVVAGKFGAFYVNPENGDGLNPKDTACLSENTTKYHEHTPLMQYTGLKDRNGKEIFEGDLLQHENPFDVPFVVCWDDEESAFVFNNGSSGYSLNDPSFSVIGNIHQNPELYGQV